MVKVLTNLKKFVHASYRKLGVRRRTRGHWIADILCFLETFAFVKIEKIVIKFSNHFNFKSLFCFPFSIRVVSGCTFNFLTMKTWANCFNFLIYSGDLCFTFLGNLSNNMSGSLWNFSFVVKLCVQMSQSVTRNLIWEILFLIEKNPGYNRNLLLVKQIFCKIKRF